MNINARFKSCRLINKSSYFCWRRKNDLDLDFGKINSFGLDHSFWLCYSVITFYLLSKREIFMKNLSTEHERLTTSDPG